VGFIRKLPHHLVASFRATLEETREADLLLHVVDVSHPLWEEQRQVVNGVLGELGVDQTPVLHVFNKVDRLDEGALAQVQERVATLLPNSVFVSAVAEDGLEPLRRALLAGVRRLRPVVELRIPVATAGRLLAEVHRRGEVLEERADDSVIVIRARVDEATLGRLRQQGVGIGEGS
jgi:GTP-binding protein HflX